MSQILISNAEFHVAKWELDFLESLRDERGRYKPDFNFQIYLN